MTVNCIIEIIILQLVFESSVFNSTLLQTRPKETFYLTKYKIMCTKKFGQIWSIDCGINYITVSMSRHPSSRFSLVDLLLKRSLQKYLGSYLYVS